MKKIIVIGAGILGASTAYHLAKNGANVVLIDRRDAGKATDAAAGIVCPWLSQRRNQKWYQLAKGGAKIYPGLIDSLANDGETDTGYDRVGALSIHTSLEKLEAMKKRALKRREDAPEIGNVTLFDHEQTKAMFPPLEDGYKAVHVSGAARVDGRKLCRSLINGAQKHGAKFISGEASILYDGKMINGVQIAGEKIDARLVIAANGVWMHELLHPLGITMNVTSQKAQLIHVQHPQFDSSKWPVIMPPNDQYILTLTDNRIVLGATHENDVGFDSRITAGGIHEILSKTLAIAPGLAESTFLESRVGFRPFTPGFLPVFGSVPGFDGLLVGNGLGASGLTMGPFIGEQLAKIALEQQLDVNLKDYDVAQAILENLAFAKHLDE
ncbi:NAD(P)/FAD-dependent oxidoreductase [Virgibacillus necropolis]|uniref:FAD-dependent oxidoreductase n=1 Tax=Virgibacillus necropolis TaxID=163877 RepID=A0A221MGL8_9BACI|nr:FAD-dependent oxidoreductase [Virgibacillus necropolis]ASN06808.1 FAD-dependent oxidoreductase [Virgibacillus necropolis]